MILFFQLDNSQGSDPAKRLSQYSDRNSLASNSTLRNEPGNTTGRSPRGSSNDYSDGGRRQDSGSGHFSDSFERRSADERRGEDAGRDGQSREGGRPSDAPVPVEMRFGATRRPRACARHMRECSLSARVPLLVSVFVFAGVCPPFLFSVRGMHSLLSPCSEVCRC